MILKLHTRCLWARCAKLNGVNSYHEEEIVYRWYKIWSITWDRNYRKCSTDGKIVAYKSPTTGERCGYCQGIVFKRNKRLENFAWWFGHEKNVFTVDTPTFSWELWLDMRHEFITGTSDPNENTCNRVIRASLRPERLRHSF